MSAGATWAEAENRIKINPDVLTRKDLSLKSIIMHEIQHAIQHKEGFASGGSPSTFFDKENMDVFQRLFQEQDNKKFNQAVLDALYSEVSIDAANKISDADDKFIDAAKEFALAEGDGEKEAALYDDAQEELNNALADAGKTPDWYAELKAKAREKAGVDLLGRSKRAKNYDPFELYKQLYGEIEARNTEARLDMSEEERAAVSPESTQDVKNADAIVIFDDGTVAAYMPEEFTDNQISDSVLYKNLPQNLKDAVDFVMNGKPVYNIRQNEFPENGESLNNRVVTFYNNEYGGKVDTEIGTILLDNKGVVSSIKHGLSSKKANAFAAVPEVLRRGKLVQTQENYKDKSENRYLFVAPVTISENDGTIQDYFCEVVVREGISTDNKGKKRFYLHEVELTKKLAGVFTERYNTLTPTSSKSIIAEQIANINRELYQSAFKDNRVEDEVRGYINISTAGGVIHLLKNADKSTIIHELGHFFVNRYLQAMVKAGRQDELKGVLDWLGADSVDFMTTEHHERFAVASDLFAANTHKYITICRHSI